MAVRIGSARIDERGKISGGKAGDQTGNEVGKQNWYLHSKGWVLLRPKDPVKAGLIAFAMNAACDNNKIGYDQGQRNTLYDLAKTAGFDPEIVTKATETDCSALVRVCCAYAGIKAGDFTTTNEASVLMATGAFTKHTGTRYTKSSDYLRAGDILVTKSKGHTVVALDDGPLAYAGEELGKRTLMLTTPLIKGADVQELQKLLTGWGFPCGKWGADGEYGSATKSAVTAWQYANGLPETGVMDADDYAMIDKLLNPEEEDDEPEPDAEDGVDDDQDDQDAATAYVTVTSGNTVNVRTAPNTGAPVLGLAYLDDAFEYLGEASADGWHKIAFGDDEGWISGKYTTLHKAPLPVDAPPVPDDPKWDAVIVDVSQHNGLKDTGNDWAKIAKNVDLLVLRCGVTRTETKPIGIGVDDDFKYAAKKCQEHGIPFGVYYYGKVKTAAEARKEADKAYDTANPYSPLFYVYDVEEGRLTDACIKAWADQMRKRGASKVGMYIGHNYYPAHKATVSAFDFIWIPRYGQNDGTYKAKYKPAYPCDIHQYTSQGKIAGFADKTLDVNRLTGSKPLSWFLGK